MSIPEREDTDEQKIGLARFEQRIRRRLAAKLRENTEAERLDGGCVLLTIRRPH